MTAVPVVASAALVLAACGGGSSNSSVAQQPAAPASDTSAAAPAAPAADAPAAAAPAQGAAAAAAVPAAPAAAPAKAAKAAKPAEAATATKTKGGKTTAKAVAGAAGGDSGLHSLDSAADADANQKAYDDKAGATDAGVTKDQIKLGTVTMHGMALGNVLAAPLVRGIEAAIEAIDDRGGILGRRVSLTDCDDGPGEVARTKACIKKLVGSDHVFSLLSVSSWGSASVHDDLKQYHLPAIGTWAYSQTEWQDPFMFPTHMSMIHEAMANAHWAVNVIQPKTYGLVCLTSPEMQLACDNVTKIMDAAGSKLVKRADVSISETSMSAYVLSMRAANPDHIIHYVINPATMAKFMVEAAQQGYYPPLGISGNHLAAEVLGSLFGKWPVGRYWTNTTYKLWGPEFIATMNKYAKGNRGINHHIVQASYVGVNIFERAAKEVGPNLTRDRLMAQLNNGDVYTADASLDQRFSYANSERNGDNWSHDMGQGREFIYKYTGTNTTSNPDGSPNGFAPDDKQFVIYTWK
ncbi:MAG TPA: ABC transporter substrate-binding protein [Sporichthyaceae bacterium]|jgi:ABC-type branched-subunit amino acid transport system substrate-binding protein